MISAPSRLQLLSGNSLWIVCCYLLFSGCSASRKLPQHPGPGTQTHPKEQPKADDKEPSGAPSAINYKKDEYTIALLLPFESNKVYIADLTEESSYYFPQESQLAVEYYQGALLALDSLQKMGLKSKILVYDVGMDTSALRNVLRKPEMKNADLLIGPVSNSSLKIASQFSLKNKVTLVSPFSATAFCNFSNPYYVFANATMRSHCEKICDFIRGNFKTNKMFLLYRNKEPDRELAKYIKDYEASKKNNGMQPLQFIELTDSTEGKYYNIKDMISSDEKNVIIVASNDEPFAKAVIKQLSKLPETSLLEVFGMPTWVNFDIDSEQLAAINTHITQNYWVNKISRPVETFKNSYLKKYNVYPTEFAVRGFDQMMYFGASLYKNGKNFEETFQNKEKTELAERFKIQPVPKSNDKQVWFYENKSLYILEYEFGKLVKVSD
ncbi:MAG: amino acid ABC transporter substrate-binding protein [Chitinophagales bacterium]|nr:amino acid ABC transporter substrate-binding protein [Chitinophagales bacterium]